MPFTYDQVREYALALFVSTEGPLNVKRREIDATEDRAGFVCETLALGRDELEFYSHQDGSQDWASLVIFSGVGTCAIFKFRGEDVALAAKAADEIRSKFALGVAA